jgi:hypothetical protein
LCYVSLQQPNTRAILVGRKPTNVIFLDTQKIQPTRISRNLYLMHCSNKGFTAESCDTGTTCKRPKCFTNSTS